MTRAQKILESVDAIIAFKREQGWLESEEKEEQSSERAAAMKLDVLNRHFNKD